MKCSEDFELSVAELSLWWQAMDFVLGYFTRPDSWCVQLRIPASGQRGIVETFDSRYSAEQRLKCLQDRLEAEGGLGVDISKAVGWRSWLKSFIPTPSRRSG